jgi:ATP-binding cassette, subfamily B, bacterial
MILRPGRSDGALFIRLFREARDYWPHIAGLFLISVLMMPLTLLTPVPLKLSLDCILGAQPWPSAMRLFIPSGSTSSGLAAALIVAMLIVVIALLRLLLEMAYAMLRAYAGERLVLSFRARLFRHVQRLSLSYHDSKGTTDSSYRIQYDAPAIQWITIDAIIPLITAFFTLIAMIIVLVRIDWELAVIAMAVAPLLFTLSHLYSRRMKLRWRDAKKVESSAFSVVQEVLSSVRVVKAFVQEDREQERYEQHAGRNLHQQVRLAFTGGMFNLINGLAMATGTGVVLFIGIRHVQSGVITVGELVLVMSYLAMLYAPLQTLSKSSASLQGSLVSAERAFALLDEAPDVVEKTNAKTLSRARGQVTFQHVSFSYNSERPAIQDISFDIAPESRVGITGTTGSGKSTLMNLLLRLYDPSSGSILLDGVDIRDYRLQDLRNQFAIVLQEPVLFSSTIAENIAYAKPNASEEEIIRAAETANIHEFISRLPQGYQTQVGERGIQLSGGERQRISLARAFLKDAPILILDEPTSSVDTATEQAILHSMENLMQGRTSFMIAHRLSTLDLCTARLHLDHGKLVSATNSQPV